MALAAVPIALPIGLSTSDTAYTTAARTNVMINRCPSAEPRPWATAPGTAATTRPNAITTNVGSTVLNRTQAPVTTASARLADHNNARACLPLARSAFGTWLYAVEIFALIDYPTWACISPEVGSIMCWGQWLAHGQVSTRTGDACASTAGSCRDDDEAIDACSQNIGPRNWFTLAGRADHQGSSVIVVAAFTSRSRQARGRIRWFPQFSGHVKDFVW